MTGTDADGAAWTYDQHKKLYTNLSTSGTCATAPDVNVTQQARIEMGCRRFISAAIPVRL